jgi:AcrR family transcriptional regulator
MSRRRRAYTFLVPKLWNETIEEHRREVRGAILDATVALVAEHGLLSVTMSQIAEETGIGRATLYKYFPDVEAILLAWHEHQINGHLDISPKSGMRRATLARGLQPCWRPTRSSPTNPAGTATPNSPRCFIETRTSSSRNSSFGTWSGTWWPRP